MAMSNKDWRDKERERENGQNYGERRRRARTPAYTSESRMNIYKEKGSANVTTIRGGQITTKKGGKYKQTNTHTHSE